MGLVHNNIKYKVSMIAAVANNNVIGINNGMPWRQPADLRYFRRLTLGHVVIMGRTTQTGLEIPFDQRINVVMSTDKNYHADGFITVSSIKDAVQLAAKVDAYTIESMYEHMKDGKYVDRELFVIGGAGIYNSFIDYADTMYITNIYADVPGDAFFPEFSMNEWQMDSLVHYDNDDANQYPYAFTLYNRISF